MPKRLFLKNPIYAEAAMHPMRFVVRAVLGLLIVAVCLIGFYRWDSAANRGWKIGYWGDFNRTSNALSSIAGGTITKTWHNLDVTIEEIGFELETNGQRVRLHFWETDAVRKMPRAEATTLLQLRIRQELDRTNSATIR